MAMKLTHFSWSSRCPSDAWTSNEVGAVVAACCEARGCISRPVMSSGRSREGTAWPKAQPSGRKLIAEIYAVEDK